MSQDIIQRILTIEQNAAQLYDDAQQQAVDIVAEAETEATALRTQRLEEAHQHARQIEADGAAQAASERARIIAQAETEVQRLEALAARNHERAVNFVLSRIIGHT